jgi:hypothetical protein
MQLYGIDCHQAIPTAVEGYDGSHLMRLELSMDEI